ncbi:glutathione S-transferase family protein [Kordiimonas sp. SCSIO 12603]|uniref:glutathione S-transferase family protein n=1 Tax=Kordiimonas sp. SCSIO 12603 TaxID=2829596 RepID=UPI002106542D|nr:glutathione S-transferase family protein [Kordiimonas sp. SCSIO 12603]UTW57395.1 glutathione S-transferase family protein [Kordiimonas sp. SCSIO 12603]
MKIYGDKISGNCLKVKYVADYLKQAYEWVDVSVVEGEAKSEAFLNINPAGQVPAIQLNNASTLAQSNAIMLFLAKDSELIPADSFLEAKMNEWLFWEQYSHETAIAVSRFQVVYKAVPFSEVDPELIKKSYAALDVMEKHLQESDWFLGDHFSLADIALYAYTQFAEEVGFDMSEYTATVLWLKNVRIKLNL